MAGLDHLCRRGPAPTCRRRRRISPKFRTLGLLSLLQPKMRQTPGDSIQVSAASNQRPAHTYLLILDRAVAVSALLRAVLESVGVYLRRRSNKNLDAQNG